MSICSGCGETVLGKCENPCCPNHGKKQQKSCLIHRVSKKTGRCKVCGRRVILNLQNLKKVRDL